MEMGCAEDGSIYLPIRLRGIAHLLILGLEAHPLSIFRASTLTFPALP